MHNPMYCKQNRLVKEIWLILDFIIEAYGNEEVVKHQNLILNFKFIDF